MRLTPIPKPLLQRLRTLALKEVQSVLGALPPDLRERAERIPVTCELRPTAGMLREGIAPDTLGLFLGGHFGESVFSTEALPSQIVLFLENLWEEADHSAAAFREEARLTYVHEIGHYLGMEEDDLQLRDL